MSDQDSVQLVLQLMQDTFKSKFKTYYDGDPNAIPLFNLPAIVVDQTGDDTVGGAFGEDDVTDHIIVKVILNKADDYDADLVKPLNTTSRKIRDYIGKLDKETRDYATKTVKYALRNTLFNDITILANDMSVEYGITPRPDADGAVNLMAEGHVKFDITYSRSVDA